MVSNRDALRGRSRSSDRNFIAIQMTRGRDFGDKLDGFAEQIMKKMLFLQGVLGHDRVAHIIEQGLGEKPTDEEAA
jgi:hypothetical protein